jgi:hypothetical protein
MDNQGNKVIERSRVTPSEIPSKSGHDLSHSCTFIQKGVLIIGLTMDHPCKREIKAC